MAQGQGAAARNLVAGRLLIVWLGLFDVIEEALGWEDAAPEHWQWWHESLDLVMWLGWLPPALLWLRYLHAKRQAATA